MGQWLTVSHGVQTPPGNPKNATGHGVADGDGVIEGVGVIVGVVDTELVADGDGVIEFEGVEEVVGVTDGVCERSARTRGSGRGPTRCARIRRRYG